MFGCLAGFIAERKGLDDTEALMGTRPPGPLNVHRSVKDTHSSRVASRFTLFGLLEYYRS
jgi:hypothetical protein